MGWQSGSEGSYLLSKQPDLRKLWISKQRGQRPQRKTLDLPCVRMHSRQGYQCSKQYSEERSRSAGDASCFIITGLLVRPGWPEPNVCGECDLCWRCGANKPARRSRKRYRVKSTRYVADPKSHRRVGSNARDCVCAPMNSNPAPNAMAG